jgi:2'-5' RNA ligase
MRQDNMMRVFIAVEISDEVRKMVAERIKHLRGEFTDLRVGWDKPEKLHLTLKFLGDIGVEKLAALKTAVVAATKDIPPFDLKIEGVGSFPPRGATRVLWLGVTDKTGSLHEIWQRLERECESIGFERERRDFKPHLTIARLKEPARSRELVRLHLETDFPAAAFRVDQLIVFQSELFPTGSRYTPQIVQPLVN